MVVEPASCDPFSITSDSSKRRTGKGRYDRDNIIGNLNSAVAGRVALMALQFGLGILSERWSRPCVADCHCFAAVGSNLSALARKAEVSGAAGESNIRPTGPDSTILPPETSAI